MDIGSLSNTLTRHWLLLVVLAIFVTVTGYHVADGPEVTGDTPRYMKGAEEFLATGTITGKAANYKGYVLFVASIKVLTSNPQLQKWLIVLFQALASSAALLCLYSLGRTLFSREAGLLAAGLYAVNFYALRWTSLIATEALFMAFIVIACWLCVKALERRSLLLPAIVVTLFAVSIRPNGTAMLPMFALIFIFSIKGPVRAGIFIALAAMMIILYPAVSQELNRTASHEQLVTHFEKGTIIWKIEAAEMPKLEKHSDDQVADVLLYIKTYPLETMSLMGKRLFAAWSWHRESYSYRHQWFLAITLSTLYVLMLTGLYMQTRLGFTSAHLLPILLILAQSAVIAVSFANHDHRFVIGVMPMVFLYSAAGAVFLSNRMPRLRRGILSP